MIEPYSKVEIPLSEYKKLIVLEDRSEREKTSLYKTCMEDCRKKLDNKLNDLQSIIDSN